MRGRAISQIQIYQALVGDTRVLRYRLEIAYRFLIKANGNLLLKLGSVRIFFGGSKVVFFAHMTPFMGRTSILEHLLYGPR
jgi:hypothetical protein